MRTARTALAAALALAALLSAAAPAAAAPSPWWALDTQLLPLNLPSGGEATLDATAVDIGDAAASGPVTLTVKLPPGARIAEEGGVPEVGFYAFPYGNGNVQHDLGPTSELSFLELCHQASPTEVSCEYRQVPELLPAALEPFEFLEVKVKVEDQGAAAGEEYEATVSGGGASTVHRRHSLGAGGGEAPFGAEEYALVPEEEGGGVDTRAGSHPFQLTTTFNLNQSADPLHPPAIPRNLHFKLPPGQIGSATAVEQCGALDFAHVVSGGEENLCPPDTAIGVASITIDEPNILGLTTIPIPLFNLAPAYGEPARFGFVFAGAPVILDTAVRSGKAGTEEGDYGVTVNVSNISQLADLLYSTVTFWGTPGDPRHDISRGWSCLVSGTGRRPPGATCPANPRKKKSPPPSSPCRPTAPRPTRPPSKETPGPTSAIPPRRSFPSPSTCKKPSASRSAPATSCTSNPKSRPNRPPTPPPPRPASASTSASTTKAWGAPKAPPSRS